MKKKEKKYYVSPTTDVVLVEEENQLMAGSFKGNAPTDLTEEETPIED